MSSGTLDNLSPSQGLGFLICIKTDGLYGLQKAIVQVPIADIHRQGQPNLQ